MGYTYIHKLISNILQNLELSAAKERVRDLQMRLQELEDSLTQTQKELVKAQEINARLQRDLKVMKLYYFYVHK